MTFTQFRRKVAREAKKRGMDTLAVLAADVNFEGGQVIPLFEAYQDVLDGMDEYDLKILIDEVIIEMGNDF